MIKLAKAKAEAKAKTKAKAKANAKQIHSTGITYNHHLWLSNYFISTEHSNSGDTFTIIMTIVVCL